MGLCEGVSVDAGVGIDGGCDGVSVGVAWSVAVGAGVAIGAREGVVLMLMLSCEASDGVVAGVCACVAVCLGSGVVAGVSVAQQHVLLSTGSLRKPSSQGCPQNSEVPAARRSCNGGLQAGGSGSSQSGPSAAGGRFGKLPSPTSRAECQQGTRYPTTVSWAFQASAEELPELHPNERQ